MTEVESPTSTALAVITEQNVGEYFKPQGLNPIIEKIKKEIAAFKPDISTDEGRKQIASMARKVASAKVRLDDLGKDLVSGLKKQTNAVDEERRRMREELDKLRDDTRMPLTEWEQREEKRTDAHKTALEHINLLLALPLEPSVAELQKRLDGLAGFDGVDFEEFALLASETIKNVRDGLTAKLASVKKADADRAELKRLQEAECSRLQKEREDKIAADAKKEAEEKAAAEIGRAEREKQEAVQRAEKAESDRKHAEGKIEEGRQKAIADEQARAAAEKKKEEDAAAAREADKKHKAKINGEAAKALQSICGFLPEHSKQVVIAIARGEIPHVKISY